MWLRRMGVLLLGLAAGCASRGGELIIRVRDEPNGPVRYEGKMAGPFDDLEELVETGCGLMVHRAAPARAPGVLGYCAVFFSAPDDEGRDRWFVGHVAPLETGWGTAERTCAIPSDLVEPRERDVLLLQRSMDPGGTKPWRPTRFLNATAGTTWSRDVLVFSLEGEGACTVYGFNGFSRTVTVRRDGAFLAIGTVYNEEGIIQALAGD